MWQPTGAHDAKEDLLGSGAGKTRHQTPDISCMLRVCFPETMGPRLPQAIAIYHKNKIEFGPAKAANAGGVAVSGLEMAQNSARLSWSKEEVDDKLKSIMKSIFNSSKEVCPKDLSPRTTVWLQCVTKQGLHQPPKGNSKSKLSSSMVGLFYWHAKAIRISSECSGGAGSASSCWSSVDGTPS